MWNRKLVLLDVGFASVSSALMFCKVLLGSQPASGLWRTRRLNGPACGRGACECSPCGPCGRRGIAGFCGKCAASGGNGCCCGCDVDDVARMEMNCFQRVH